MAKMWHKQMFRPSDMRRGGQLLLRPIAFRALYKDVYTLVSFPFSYNTIHLEKPGFHKNICRKENLGIQPGGNMGHNVRKSLELLKDQNCSRINKGVIIKISAISRVIPKNKKARKIVTLIFEFLN